MYTIYSFTKVSYNRYFVTVSVMGLVTIQLIRIIGVLLNIVHIDARGPRHDKELVKQFNIIKRYKKS